MFEQLKLHLLEEGRFTCDLDDYLQKLGQAITNFAHMHGGAADGAKGKVTAEIEIKINAQSEQPSFTIATKIKSQEPGRPVRQTTGVTIEVNERPILAVPAGGSHEGNAYQRRLFNGHGSPLDPDTQKPKNKNPKKP